MAPALSAAPSIPSGWPAPDPADLDRAHAAALDALSTSGARPVQLRLAEHYDAALHAVGSTFLDLTPNLSDDITPADLLAVHLLGAVVEPLDARRLLEPGPVRSVVLTSLAALPDGDLALADAELLEAMELLRVDVAAALASPRRSGRDRWTTAEQLCARKRPDLFPLPDPVVRRLLLPGHLGGDHRTDWLVLRHLLRDDDVRAALWTAQDAAREVAGHESVVLDLGLLRILGVALQTYVARQSGMDP
jgi:hypothetical protein